RGTKRQADGQSSNRAPAAQAIDSGIDIPAQDIAATHQSSHLFARHDPPDKARKCANDFASEADAASL
ncbi:hypothetical protein, partial [Burkholderia gladioli]|uniref:hypothetical protein n=1 Tax=Burkholderia gladioli TaxID=28095 RepID=UPI0034DAF39F